MGLCIKPLMQQLKSSAHACCGINRSNQLFAAVKYFKAAMAEGIKPILQQTCTWRDPDKPLATPIDYRIMRQNDRGYHHLLTLISESYLHGSIMVWRGD